MSYFDDASLVMIPSGYKTSKVYSVKPTDGSGDLTFSRSNDTATRVNSAGLIEKVRTNLALRSQSFATSAVWATVNGTVTNNAGTAPDGTNTASKIVATDADPFVYQSLTLSDSVVVSCYVKGIGSSIGKNGSIRAASSLTNFTITGDWQRVSLIHTASGAQNYGVETPESAAVSDEVLLWGFQVEYGDVATDYIATTTAAVSVGPVANVPRLDYLNSTCPRLLLEPQRTNTITFSEDVTSCLTSQTGTTVTANATASPDGYQSADLIAFTSGSYRLRNQTVAAATTYTMSVFYKNNTFSGSETVLFNMSDGVIGGLTITILPAQNTATFAGSAGAWTGVSGKVENYGNGWYRVSATGTSVNGGGGWYEIASSFSKSAYFWGFSLEIGAYATSYIPTLGAAVTRGADTASKTSASALIGQTEGTLFCDVEWTVKPESGSPIISLVSLNNTTNLQNCIVLGIERAAGGSNRFYSFVQVSNSTTAALIGSNITNGRYKAAFAYKENDFVLYVNGVQIATDTSGAVPTNSQVIVGGRFVGDSFQVSDPISQALVFKTRLPNSSLAELTSL